MCGGGVCVFRKKFDFFETKRSQIVCENRKDACRLKSKKEVANLFFQSHRILSLTVQEKIVFVLLLHFVCVCVCV